MVPMLLIAKSPPILSPAGNGTSGEDGSGDEYIGSNLRGLAGERLRNVLTERYWRGEMGRLWRRRSGRGDRKAGVGG